MNSEQGIAHSNVEEDKTVALADASFGLLGLKRGNPHRNQRFFENTVETADGFFGNFRIARDFGVVDPLAARLGRRIQESGVGAEIAA